MASKRIQVSEHFVINAVSEHFVINAVSEHFDLINAVSAFTFNQSQQLKSQPYCIFSGDLEDVLERARETGVEKVWRTVPLHTIP